MQLFFKLVPDSIAPGAHWVLTSMGSSGTQVGPRPDLMGDGRILSVLAPSMFQSVAYVPTDQIPSRLLAQSGWDGALVARPAFVLSNPIHPSIHPSNKQWGHNSKQNKNRYPNGAIVPVGDTRCMNKK